MANNHFIAFLYGTPLDYDNLNGGWQVGGILNPPRVQSFDYSKIITTAVTPAQVVGKVTCNSIITILPSGLSRNGIPERYFSDMVINPTPQNPTVLSYQYYSNSPVNDGIYRIYESDGTTILYEVFFSFFVTVTVSNTTPATSVIFYDGNGNYIDITNNVDTSGATYKTYYYKQTSGTVSRSASAEVIVNGANGGVTNVAFDTTATYRGFTFGAFTGGTSVSAQAYQGTDGASSGGGINQINVILLSNATIYEGVSPQGGAYKVSNTSIISPQTQLNWNAVSTASPLANQLVSATPPSGTVSITYPILVTTKLYILFPSLTTGLYINFTELLSS